MKTLLLWASLMESNVCNYQRNQQLCKSKSNFTFWKCWNQITVQNQKDAKQRIKESFFKVQRIKKIKKDHFSNIRINEKSKLQSSNKMMNLVPKKSSMLFRINFGQIFHQKCSYDTFGAKEPSRMLLLMFGTPRNMFWISFKCNSCVKIF